MAGKVSGLCRRGPEKVASASKFSPQAIATEPILLEVSRAKMKGFFNIFRAILGACILKVFSKGLL